jgi:large subunit ribosomal protein L1
MPNPKTGTVTMEVGKAVQEVKAGKIDFKVDKFGIVHASVARMSFEPNKIYENTMEVLQTILKLKPATAKGTYVKSVTVSSTMSPGVKVDPKSISK